MSMEPDARELLVKVSKSMGSGLVWLMINMTIGIYLGWLFFSDHMTIGNYVFYSFMILSLAGLIWYNVRIWK
jgi:hypothetical protein